MDVVHESTRPDVLNVAQAAGQLGVSINQVRIWLRQERLHGVKLGAAGWRIHASEIDRLLEVPRD